MCIRDRLINDNNMGEYRYKKQLMEVIKECVNQNYFRFNNKIYIQKKGLPMGSSLSPILAKIYMNDFEKQLITSTKYKDNIKLWSRYVDDVLVVWEGNIEEVHEFINEVNNKDKRCV